MMIFGKRGVDKISRAQGCLMGQLAGDALGSLVEFETPESIRRKYPSGIKKMQDGGTWNTIAGQLTDDSEMALLLARMFVKNRTYNPEKAKKEYLFWLESKPFDCGITINNALRGRPNPISQANGALMRISPLGIFGADYDHEQVAEWAIADAELTHPHIVCQQVNALFTMAIAYSVKTGEAPRAIYKKIVEWAEEMSVESSIVNTIKQAKKETPDDYTKQQGWVLIAFQNALYQLMNTKSFKKGVIDTVMRGGDTDTNAAICGALLGSVYGIDAVPKQWVKSILNCRPQAGKSGVVHPRPECFWPTDALELATNLLGDK